MRVRIVMGSFGGVDEAVEMCFDFSVGVGGG